MYLKSLNVFILFSVETFMVLGTVQALLPQDLSSISVLEILLCPPSIKKEQFALLLSVGR